MANILEERTEELFSDIGFSTQKHTKIKGYEIDVLAQYKGIKIAIECKQRCNIASVIHEWNSKKFEIGIEKILIITYGSRVLPNHRRLAHKYGIYLWDADDFRKYCKLAEKDKEKALSRILDKLQIWNDGSLEIEEEGAYGEILSKMAQEIINLRRECLALLKWLESVFILICRKISPILKLIWIALLRMSLLLFLKLEGFFRNLKIVARKQIKIAIKQVNKTSSTTKLRRKVKMRGRKK